MLNGGTGRGDGRGRVVSFGCIHQGEQKKVESETIIHIGQSEGVEGFGSCWVHWGLVLPAIRAKSPGQIRKLGETIEKTPDF